MNEILKMLTDLLGSTSKAHQAVLITNNHATRIISSLGSQQYKHTDPWFNLATVDRPKWHTVTENSWLNFAVQYPVQQEWWNILHRYCTFQAAFPE